MSNSNDSVNSIFTKISAGFQVFQKGKVVANPERWKKGQITVTALAPVLVAMVEAAKAFGYPVPISETQCIAIAGGIIAVVNIVCTIVSTDKIGLGSGSTPLVWPEPNPDPGSEGIEGSKSRSDLGYERTSGPSSAFNLRDNSGG